MWHHMMSFVQKYLSTLIVTEEEMAYFNDYPGDFIF